MKQLEVFQHGDGAHWGLADWYPDKEEALKQALLSKEDFTTGWYGSKKEIASARISLNEDIIKVEVSVSDDFDTEGYGMTEIPYTTDFVLIEDAIHDAWGEAIEKQKGNSTVELWTILKDGRWIETYLFDPFDRAVKIPPAMNTMNGDFKEIATALPIRKKLISKTESDLENLLPFKLDHTL